MPPSRENLGRLELDVLRYIADHHPISVREVARHFAEKSGHARTTLLTVMERLRSKGFLKRRKVAGAQRYSPTAAKSEFLQQIIGDFVGNVLGGSVSPFVAYLTNSPQQLTAEEARKLTELLRRIESKKKGDRRE